MKDFKLVMITILVIGLIYFEEINKMLNNYGLLEVDQQIRVVNVCFFICVGLLIGFFIASLMNNNTTTAPIHNKPIEPFIPSQTQQMTHDTSTPIGDAIEECKNGVLSVIDTTFQQRRTEIKQYYEGRLTSNKGMLIKNIRTRFDLSQKELGELIGVTPNMVSRYENNNARLNYDKVRSNISIIDLPVNYFV